MCSCVVCPRWLCLGRWVGLDYLQRSLLSSEIVQFYDPSTSAAFRIELLSKEIDLHLHTAVSELTFLYSFYIGSGSWHADLSIKIYFAIAFTRACVYVLIFKKVNTINIRHRHEKQTFSKYRNNGLWKNKCLLTEWLCKYEGLDSMFL